ncbi:hypothetical protein [Klenkia soli]|uniref:hypothetical protein n=1 Tax=Klenkia soli TaxID=1052260 RepID=UPI0013F4C163|nr:hypothetical protein [Klenkia soli]
MNSTAAGRRAPLAPALPTSSAWLAGLAGHLLVQLRAPRHGRRAEAPGPERASA